MKKKKKAKDATGSPHNLANLKSRGSVKVKPKPPLKKVGAPMDSRTPNNFHRSGNAADEELSAMRGMDKQKQMLQRRKK